MARRPRTDYVARLVGLNLYRGVAADRQVTVGDVSFSVAESLDGPAFVAFSPAAVALYRTRPDGSPRNLWQATIEGIERHGDNVRIHLEGPITASADVTPAAVADLDLTPGQRDLGRGQGHRDPRLPRMNGHRAHNAVCPRSLRS